MKEFINLLGDSNIDFVKIAKKDMGVINIVTVYPSLTYTFDFKTKRLLFITINTENELEKLYII